MKTFVPLKQNYITLMLVIVFTASITFSQAQSVAVNLSNGLDFQNPQYKSGPALQPGAEYLFSNVANNVDAVVRIDSLVNGAQVDKIDDNSNGTGYKAAFQPAIKAGGIIGMSYAVFTIKFYTHGTLTPVALQTVNATAVDLDGNNTLKELCRINIGSGTTINYMSSTIDISVVQMGSGDFMAQNILGVERSGIDTLYLNNMFTATGTNISSFSVKYGAITTNASSPTRQYSMYMKGFYYPGSTLPVKLISFTAALNNNKVDLKWTTASEINVSHFTIEKSYDGKNFNDAGMVFAYGNTSEKANYIFPDNISNTQQSIIYYRLRSTDNDGKTQLSETRIVRIGKQGEGIKMITYPNPVTNELRVTVPSVWQGKTVILEVFNQNGQRVKAVQSGSASQTETIMVNDLGKGFYLVKASCGTETAQQKIIKN